MRSAAALIAILFASCLGSGAGIDVVRIVPEPDAGVPAFDRVRVEIEIESAVAVFERRASGGEPVAFAPPSGWTGGIEVWALAPGDGRNDRVVGWGAAVAEPATSTITVALAAADDEDGDWVPDAADLCVGAYDPWQRDGDGDGVGDECDVCPAVADALQEDADEDGIGDACDPAICGNSAVEPGEDCDDGDDEPGGGCSAECLREECGNLRIDPGEECDDGDDEAGDACDACASVPQSLEADTEILAARPAAIETGDGELLVAWAEPDGSGSRNVRLGIVARDGTMRATASPWTTDLFTSPILFAASRDRDALIIWLDDAATSGFPRRVAWAAIPGAMSGFGPVSALIEAERVAAWAPGDRGEAAAVVFGEPTGAPGALAWLDALPAAPVIGADASEASFRDVARIVGVRRADRGWLIAWIGRSSERPVERDALWARRFDAGGEAIDAASIFLGDAEEADALHAAWDPASDRYLIVRSGSSGSGWWHSLDATAPDPPPDGVDGPSLDYGTTFLAMGDGSFLAASIRGTGDGCRLIRARVDSAGSGVDAERSDVVEAASGALPCAGKMIPLRDGRAVLLWTRHDPAGTMPDALRWRTFANAIAVPLR